MLNFLNTAVLALAAAALLPFILHLFSRRKVKVVPFSSITFLKAMQKRQVRAIKIKQLLLLIIRTLIILAVVMAFARPATRGGYLGSHATVSAVIVIDNSASMGLSVKDGRLFDLALKKAAGILNQMEQSDEAAIITTAGDFSRVQGENAFGNPAAATDFLEAVELTDSRADLTQSFDNARRLLGDRLNLNREIYFISDFQENSFDPEKTIEDFEGTVFLVDLSSDDVDNAAVIGVDLGNQLIEVGTEFILTVTVKKTSGGGDEEILASVYLDDKRMAQDGIRLNAGETASLLFDLVVTGPGFHAGSVTLSDDDLLADNIHYFSFYIPEQFTVLLAGDGGIDTRLFQAALAPDETVRRHWSVQTASYASFPSIRLNQYDVLILSNYASLPAGEIARITDYVKRGGGLLVNLGRQVDSAHYNRYLTELTGVTATSSFPEQFSRGGYYMGTDFDLEHQILSVLREGNPGTDPGFRTYALIKSSITDPGRTTLLARYSDGSPAITVSRFERGRVMLLNGDISPDISDISLHPFFVPFIVRSCEFLSSDFSSHSETIAAGSSPSRALKKSFNVKNEFILVTPDGRRRILPARQEDEFRLVDCGRIDRSGVYTILNGTTVSDRFAVNVDPLEGDLYRTDWDDLADRFHVARRLPYDADLAGFIAESRFGRELWQYFLAAAILLLAVEMLVARDRGAPMPSEE